MSIERNLRKLQAADTKPGDKLPRVSRPSLALGERAGAPTANADFQRAENELFKSSGPATLGMANDFGWLPQRAVEIQNGGRTAIDLGNHSGGLILNVDHAMVYAVIATGPLNISFDTQEILESYNRSGIEIEFVIKIDNTAANAITVTADHWAPYDTAPTLNKAGFHEIVVSITIFSSRRIVCAYPVIQQDPA